MGQIVTVKLKLEPNKAQLELIKSASQEYIGSVAKLEKYS